MKLRPNLPPLNHIRTNTNKNREKNSLNKIINISQSKDEILFCQKSFLEILLGLIKKVQVDYLTNSKSKDNESKKHLTNILIIKQILKELKQNLTEIKNEKDKKIYLFRSQKKEKESNLKKLIFSTVYSKRSVSNYNYINTNYETLITENNENYFNKETPELKLLNFKVENEILKVENLTKRLFYIIQYYKTPHLIHEHQTEIIFESQKENESMNQLLHQKLIQQREQFIEIVNMKSLQDMRINNIQSQTIGYKNAMKDYLKSSRYVNTQEVIQEEENKSYLDTINEDEKIERNVKNSKNDEINDDINKSDNNINKSNINLKNLKLIDMNEVEKFLKLNMNINVNINYNKQYINNHFDNNKKEKNEKDSSNDSKNENIDDNDSDLDKKNIFQKESNYNNKINEDY